MLALAMLEDVLHALREAPAVGSVWVTTRDPLVAEIAQRHGALAFHDSAENLNDALSQAAAACIAAGAQQLLIMHGDLPLVQPSDIALLAEVLASGADLALAPAGDGGTNALACIAPPPIPFFFGNASLARHLAEARERNRNVQLVRSRGLERDIDRPEDLIWLFEQTTECAAQRFVRKLGILERVACV
jgi:2-phospho-L-lactate guanylyltransferase